MKDNNNYIDGGVKVYKNERSEEFDIVTDDEFIDLLKENKVEYNVFRKVWFYALLLSILLSISFII